VKTGISGECLRTGKIQRCADTENDPLVDLEVCRSLGLRSIAVLPIRGRYGISGILEVFSPRPAAFTKQHIAFLQQLADLAERARTSQPENASSAAKLPSVIEQEQTTGPLPASDLARDAVVVPPHSRSRPFVVGAIGLVAVSLLALAIWLGGRGRNQAKGNATQAAPSSSTTASVNSANAGTATHLPAGAHPPDDDQVWKANPGGESLSPSREKPSAGVPVKLASKVDSVVGNKTRADRSPVNRSLSPGGLAPNVVVKYGLPNSKAGSKNGSLPDPRSNLRSDAAAPVEALPIPAGSTSSSALNAVLAAKVLLPALGVPVSQGVSGGQLVHHVPPVYPAQARVQHLEGKVVLAAVILEDGTLRDVKVIEGQPLLAQSAVDAVKHWRYKPYVLDGKPVKNETTITVDFKFPGTNH
jgi:TonB family protein